MATSESVNLRRVRALSRMRKVSEELGAPKPPFYYPDRDFAMAQELEYFADWLEANKDNFKAKTKSPKTPNPTKPIEPVED